ncbi:MAG: hypothetical protein V1775_14105 [Bacteroidota bacterium]
MQLTEKPDSFLLIPALLVFILISKPVTAQLYKAGEHWYIGPKAGMISFFGDLSVHDFSLVKKLSHESDFACGLLLGKAISRSIDSRVTFIRGNMKGSNQSLDMFFSNSFSEFNMGAAVSISHIFWPGYNRGFSFSANIAAGFICYRSIKYRLSDGSFLSSEGYTPQGENSGTAGSSLVIPLGIELVYRTVNRLLISGEYSYRLLNTDILDSQTGNTGIKDRYSYTSIGCFYIIAPIKKEFSEKYDCPGW